MKRVAVAALVAFAVAGCSLDGPAELKPTKVKQPDGSYIYLNCVHAGSGSGSQLSCDFTPLHPTPTVTVTEAP